MNGTMRRRIIPIVGTLLVVLVARADDRRLWLNQGVETGLSDRWKAGLNQEFRLANNEPNFSAYLLEASFKRETATWLDLGFGYRQQWEQGEEQWLVEYRPFVNATLKWKLWNIPFSHRSQFEWRTLEGRSDQVRYRNKLAAESREAWTTWQIRPYVADEFFYDNDQKQFLKSRLSVGLKGRPLRDLSSDVFVAWESSDTGVKGEDMVYITGLKLVVAF